MNLTIYLPPHDLAREVRSTLKSLRLTHSEAARALDEPEGNISRACSSEAPELNTLRVRILEELGGIEVEGPLFAIKK